MGRQPLSLHRDGHLPDPEAGRRQTERQRRFLAPQRRSLRGRLDLYTDQARRRRPSCAVLAFRDVTQRKRQEHQLREALSEVENLRDRLQAENAYLQAEVRNEGRFDSIVGESPTLKAVLDQVDQVAPTNSSVLVIGESGDRQGRPSRARFTISAVRRDRPLIKVNCGAITPTLIESELFGHEKGAFTGAARQRQGHFELADGGTIFLDEVGELPLDAQVKLLRVLQEHEISRVGSETAINVDVRVIAATNRDLVEMVEERQLPHGPVLPPQRVPVDHPAAARAARRHPAAGRQVPRRPGPLSGARASAASPKTACTC